jgi:hypothetical protein
LGDESNKKVKGIKKNRGGKYDLFWVIKSGESDVLIDLEKAEIINDGELEYEDREEENEKGAISDDIKAFETKSSETPEDISMASVTDGVIAPTAKERKTEGFAEGDNAYKRGATNLRILFITTTGSGVYSDKIELVD